MAETGFDTCQTILASLRGCSLMVKMSDFQSDGRSSILRNPTK